MDFKECLSDEVSDALNLKLTIEGVTPDIKGGWGDFPKAGQSKSPYVPLSKGDLLVVAYLRISSKPKPSERRPPLIPFRMLQKRGFRIKMYL